MLASDAFFPFGDTVETAAKHGIAAIIQPGGSIRDEESIKAADEAGIAMVFTSIRHFKHNLFSLIKGYSRALVRNH